MKIILVMLLLSSPLVFGSSFFGKVSNISWGMNQEDHLLKLDSGRVIFIKNNKIEDFINLKMEVYYKIFIDNNNYLKKLIPIYSKVIGLESQVDEYFMPKPFEPTILKESQQAKNIFLRMRRNYKNSGQCFNRAHIWSFEEFKKYKTKLQKVFLFFTDRYIRLYRFHWWFHVAPLTYVGTLPRVLDRRYATGPLHLKSWSDFFMKSKRSCPLINNYSDYSLNQQSQHCFLMKSSMYQIIPRDLEKLELYGEGKEYFTKNDLDKAYKDAFFMPSR
jgi:hypothetical protein